MKELMIILRNTVALIFTWLCIILIVLNQFVINKIINSYVLGNLLLFSILIGILFVYLFRSKFSDKSSFIKKMNLFVMGIVIIEVLFLMNNGLYAYLNNFNWGIFIGIIVCIYLINLFIYYLYSRNKEKEYNKKLYEYQQIKK